MRTNKCIKKQHLEYHLSVHIGMIKKMRQILSSMWLCALFSWKVDHINPLFRKRPCRCLDSGAMEWNHFWWSNMTNSIYQVSQKYMWKMLRSTNPTLLLNEGIPRALKGKKLRLKIPRVLPSVFELFLVFQIWGHNTIGGQYLQNINALIFWYKYLQKVNAMPSDFWWKKKFCLFDK